MESSKYQDRRQHSTLSLNRLRCQVKLGWTQEERESAQTVFFDLAVRFPRRPSACLSDQLEGTICYGAAAARIRAVCEAGEYQLIERLAYRVHDSLRQSLPQDVLLWLKLTKEKPPVPDLEGGASFSLGDWEQEA